MVKDNRAIFDYFFHTIYSKRPLSVNDFLLEAVICVWTWVTVNLNPAKRGHAAVF